MINIYSDNPSMDIRRVQVTGGSSFMITLPKEWAESVGLKKNDPVMVVPQPGGGLLLSVGGVQAPPRATTRRSTRTGCRTPWPSTDS